MFPTSEASTQILKVTLGDEVRRLTLKLAADTSAATAFDAVQQAVRNGFHLEAGLQGLALKYSDDEGDFCSLTEHSMDDLVILAAGGPWRLQASLGASPSADLEVKQADSGSSPQAFGCRPDLLPSAQAEHTEPAVAASPSTKMGKGSTLSPDHSDGLESSKDEDLLPPQWATAELAFQALPLISGMAQSHHVRSALNHMGVAQRARCLAFCCDVDDQLELVPEAAPLRSRLVAYIEGSDAEHFGDFLADLLSAWAGSASPELVQDAIAIHHAAFVSIMMSAFKAVREAKGKGKGKCEGKGKGKGKWGKGWGKDWGPCWDKGWGKGGDRCWQKGWGKGGPLAALTSLVGSGPGGILGGQAGGMTATTDGSSMHSMHEISDGLSKPEPSAPITPSVSFVPAPAADAALPVVASPTETPTNSMIGQAEGGHEFAQKVDLLLEMGLVGDREVASDLLRENGGSIEQVAAMLAG